MSKQSQVEQFVEDMRITRVSELALILDIQFNPLSWRSDEWLEQEDILRVNVTDKLIELLVKETPHA